MEGTVNKIKAVKRAMYNRANVEILRAKLIYGGNKMNWNYHLN
jgi:transposase